MGRRKKGAREAEEATAAQRKAAANASAQNAIAKTKGKELNERQRRFVEEYVIDPNACQAARLAGYSKSTAQCAKQSLLGKPEIAEAIAKAREARASRMEIKADAVLKEIAMLASTDIRVFNIDPVTGKVTIADHASEDFGRAIRKIKRKYDIAGHVTEAEIELWDKNTNLRMLAQHLGLLVDRVDVTSGGERVKQVIRFGGKDIEF